MAQHIPLEKSSESTFTKAIKNIKHYMKDKEKSAGLDNVTRNVPKGKGKRSVLGKAPSTTKPGKHHGRGVVYLRHIPKGFHEKEMNSYFSMFGRVTRLKMVRSKSTGNPKGYAFIEFLYSEVAQVVAETMNNYLMWGKLLKAEYIPAEKVHRNTFWNAWICPDNCPRTKLQSKVIEKTNRKFSEEEVVKLAEHELKRLIKLKKQMAEEGILFDCQVDGILQASDNIMDKAVQSNNEFANGPVLVLDESDDEIEYKIHPNVTVIRRGPSNKNSLDPENRQDKQNKSSPTKSGGKKGHKRSLSSSSVEASVPKKRMSLLDRLKSKSDSSESYPANLGKKAIVKLMRVDRSSQNSTPKPVNSSPKSSSSIKQNSGNGLLSAKKINLSAKKNKTPLVGSTNTTNSYETTEIATADLSSKKFVTPKMKLTTGSSSKKSVTPKIKLSSGSSSKKSTPRMKLSVGSSSKKSVTPKIKLSVGSSLKKSPKIKHSMGLSSKKSTPKTKVSSSKKSPNIEGKSAQLKKTPNTASPKIKVSSSVKKKKIPLLVGKRLAFSTSKKKSSIPRLTKIQN